jgi:hypothetical protein
MKQRPSTEGSREAMWPGSHVMRKSAGTTTAPPRPAPLACPRFSLQRGNLPPRRQPNFGQTSVSPIYVTPEVVRTPTYPSIPRETRNNVPVNHVL